MVTFVVPSTLHVSIVAPSREVGYRLRSSPRQSTPGTVAAAMTGEERPSMQRDELVTPRVEPYTNVISAPRRVERCVQVAGATPNSNLDTDDDDDDDDGWSSMTGREHHCVSSDVLAS